MAKVASPAPGMDIDGFVLEEKLCTGGMATLWSVRRSKEHEAVKGMPLLMKIPELGDNDDPTAIVGFEVEQMIMPKLHGIHVPQFIACGDFTSQPYIVMERISGGTLRTRFNEAPLTAADIAAIGAKVAIALHELHRQHVIHLDIKPSNIMFRPSGEAVLIDFGLSRHDHLPDLLGEEFRLPLGTAPYLSPEQVLHIRNDPRSDQFALGALLYHLSTGKRALGNPDSVHGLRRRLYRDVTPPRGLNPNVPPWLQEIIMRCLEIDPAARYESAAQLAFDLNNPEQVTLTERAQKTERDGLLPAAKRWFHAIGIEATPQQSASRQLSKAPIIVVAIDLDHGSDSLSENLLLTARRILQAEPGARLACISVQKTSRIVMNVTVDKEGRNLHVAYLVKLKHWAEALHLPPERITCHVLEAPDPATAIVEYASMNEVDHIIIGSRGSSTLRRYLGSVSAQVVAQAICTVTVVKASVNATPPAEP